METKALVEFQCYERSLHLALKRINEFPFVVYYVDSEFCTNSSFSHLDLQLAVHNDGRRRFALSFNLLFKVEAKPEYSDALKFIYRSRNCLWPLVHANPNFKQSEKKMILGVCSKILVPLCKEVILEKRYRVDLSKMPMIAGLKCGDIGMGSVHTWHGTPDVRVRGGLKLCVGNQQRTLS